MNDKKINFQMIIFSIIGAIVAFAVNEVFLFYLFPDIPLFVLVGIYFMVIALFMMLSVLICETRNHRINGYYWKINFSKNSFAFIPVLIIVVCLIAGFFQFIYNFSFTVSASADDYIIIVDNSGSMEVNDPDNQRNDAIINLVNRMKNGNRIAIYTFELSPHVLMDFQNVTDSSKEHAKNLLRQNDSVTTGGTDIRSVLDLAITDIEPQLDPRRHTSVFLLSDGLDHSFFNSDVQSHLIKYIDNKVKINTILLYDTSGLPLMQQLSDLTGGESVYIQEAEALYDAYNQLFELQNDRSLLEARYSTDNGAVLYIIMRVVFITLLGVLLCLTVALVLDNKFYIASFLIKGLFGGLLAGLVLEFGLSNGFFSSSLLRFAAVLLLSVIFTRFEIKIFNDDDNPSNYQRLRSSGLRTLNSDENKKSFI